MNKIIQLFAVALLALGLSACGDSTNTPEEAVKIFFTSIEKGDVDGMFKVLDLSDVPEGEIELIKPKFEMVSKEMAEEFKKQGGLKSINVKGVEYNDDKSTAKVNIELVGGGKDSEPSNETIPVKKVDGQWKIADF